MVVEVTDGGLFSPIAARCEGMLEVDDLHAIYWEECGAAEGIPLVFLHGGPGGPLGPVVRQYFDPSLWRIIYFHQRGAGRSTPLGETRQNTTQLLIADLEALRVDRGVERWVVAGGSWGSTLALAYAQKHRDACLALLLNGIFLGRQRDIDWFFTASRDFFPEAWEAFVNFLPPNERDDYFSSYARRILDDDPTVSGPAVRAWSMFEGSIAALVPSRAILETFQDPQFALSYSRMNVHYFSQQCFLQDAPILGRMDRLSDLAAILVHGRYDLATAYRSAVELTRSWPSARLVTVPDAGHSRFEPANVRVLIKAQAELAEQLRLSRP